MVQDNAFLYSDNKLRFYIAASDQDILAQVKHQMSRGGLVGMMDTAGRLHYVVDGRRGSPFVSRRIIDKTDQLVREEQAEYALADYLLPAAANQVLARYAIRHELKGYRYLRFILLSAGFDETRLRPVSKTLYPAAAEHFRVKTSQVERDIRYALKETELKQQGLTTTAVICRLYDEMIAAVSREMVKNNPPATRN